MQLMVRKYLFNISDAEKKTIMFYLTNILEPQDRLQLMCYRELFLELKIYFQVVKISNIDFVHHVLREQFSH